MTSPDKLGVIHLDFAVGKMQLNWRDLLYGYRHRFLGWQQVVDFATKQTANDNPIVFDLACVTKDGTWQVGDLLDKLANQEGEADEQETKDKWLFLVLSWLYDNRRKFEDPLGVVEEIFSDFDYPVRLKTFIRFIPPKKNEPVASSHEAAIEVLMSRWREYLHQEQQRFSSSR